MPTPGGLDTQQLTWLVRQDPLLRDQWAGVFAADQLPDLETVNRPCGLIVNTDPARLPGTHWVALYYGRDGQDEFFDSYGKAPTSYRRDWNRHLNPQYRYNTRALQGDDTTVCGHYCVYYLKGKARGQSLSALLRPFRGPKAVNDRKICHWVCRSPRLLPRYKARGYCQSSVCGREGTRRRRQCCE
jgi:hypothetical protein